MLWSYYYNFFCIVQKKLQNYYFMDRGTDTVTYNYYCSGPSRNLRRERWWMGGARGGGRGALRQWATEDGSDPATLRLSHELRHGGPHGAPVDPPCVLCGTYRCTNFTELIFFI